MSTIDEHRGPWRFEELAALPDDDGRYEVVDGALVVTPPPTQLHQFVGSVLLKQLLFACPPEWRVVDEWPLPLGTDGRVPDLAVLAADAPVSRSGTAYPAGPEHVGLLVEVVSPSSRKTDRFMKPGECAEAGVPLFWRVETDPDLLLLAHRLGPSGYQQVAAVAERGDVPVPWGTLEVDLAEARAWGGR